MDTQTSLVEVAETFAVTGKGKRSVSLVGYTTKAAVRHFEDHLTRRHEASRWCSVECMARTFYHSAHPSNVRRIRRGGKVNKLFHYLAGQRRFLLVQKEPGGYRAVTRVKLLPPCPSVDDWAIAKRQIDEMAATADNRSGFTLQAIAAFEGSATGLPHDQLALFSAQFAEL